VEFAWGLIDTDQDGCVNLGMWTLYCTIMLGS
jgi:hypothetical protein